MDRTVTIDGHAVFDLDERGIKALLALAARAGKLLNPEARRLVEEAGFHVTSGEGCWCGEEVLR